MHLDFCLLFSSAAAVLGARNAIEYAAANEYLGALAEYRASLGLPATAIDWGMWDYLSTVPESSRTQLLRSGLRPVSESAALDFLSACIGAKATRRMVA